jgi:tripeptide aminopeptidase
MINKDRMVEEFISLISIDSLSRNERKMADALKKKLQDIGYEVMEDDAGEKIGGNAGNIICNIKGSKDVPALMLTAHMDTVQPGIWKKYIIEGGYIKTDGTTVLGGDDAAGLACVLESLKVLKENNIEHGDIQIVFTIGEEEGLFGAKNLDYSKIYAKYAVVLDSHGPIGTVAVKAPSLKKIAVKVTGKAAHAGLEPEKGINAIKIASEAISKMTLGRIDSETTANIGVINGGNATNIVCESVNIQAEARSMNKQKLDRQTAHMKDCFEMAARKFGGSVEFKSEMDFPSFSIPEDSPIIDIMKKAADAAGIKLVLEDSGGGSDTNIINSKGIQAVNISVGMDKVHTVDEQISIDDMVKAAEFVTSIIKNIA